MIGEQGVNGHPTVFASAKTFECWAGEPPDDPAGFVGLLNANGVVVVGFHDPEATYVFAVDGGAVFVQWIAAASRDRVNEHLAKRPAAGWKRMAGSYLSEGGEHVLFDSILTASAYTDPNQAVFIGSESGPLQRIVLAEGAYALEEYGIWKPDNETELVLARLVLA